MCQRRISFTSVEKNVVLRADEQHFMVRAHFYHTVVVFTKAESYHQPQEPSACLYANTISNSYYFEMELLLLDIEELIHV